MPTVALTFDDGLDSESTLGVLKALGRRPATFFVRGEQFKHCDCEVIFGDVLAAGCEIQAHCSSHAEKHSEMSEEEIRADITELLGDLESLAVPRPTLWRPPYGDYTNDTKIVAASLDPPLTITQWQVDSHDAEGWSAEEMLKSIMQALLRGGHWAREHAVVLLHDHAGANPQRADASETERVVQMLIEAIEVAGGELVVHGPTPAWWTGG